MHLDATRAAASRNQLTGDGWQFVKEVEGVQIFRRWISSSDYPQAMAKAMLGAAPQQVYAVISDYDHFADFIPYVRESTTVGRRAGIRWVYQRLRFPGPISDRRYVIRIEDVASHTRDSYYRVEWRLSRNEAYPVADASGVDPAVMSGSWDLRPSGDGTETDATYVVHLDPGGVLPAWLMSLATDSYLPKVMAAVRDRVRSTSRAARVRQRGLRVNDTRHRRSAQGGESLDASGSRK